MSRLHFHFVLSLSLSLFLSLSLSLSLALLLHAVPSLRMQNLQLLIRNVKHFYLTQLQQLVITGLPNITHIAHCPETGKTL